MTAWIAPWFRKELDQINEAAQRMVQERQTAIDACCYVALEQGCGVRVDDYTDGAWSVGIDRTRPAREIREYRHAHPQPFKDQDYRHPGCVNCDSLMRDRHA